jgi:hypothetical protein
MCWRWDSAAIYSNGHTIVKIFCRVHDKPAVVVGYAPGRKGKPKAIVLCEGKLYDVALKYVIVDLDAHMGKVVEMKAGVAK